MKKLTKSELTLLGSLLDRAVLNNQQPACSLTSVPATTPAPVDEVKAVLNQRGERYGDFTDHARLAQTLQNALRNHTVPTDVPEDFPEYMARFMQPWNNLSDVQKQALTVICDKLARIISGDCNYDDNWIDIQGYARLAQERLPKLEATNTAPE